MAEGTRLRGLDERCTALDQAFQDETVRRVMVEQSFQEQLHSAKLETIEKLDAMKETQEFLSQAVGSLQSQFRQMLKKLEQICQKDVSVLGRPPPGHYIGEGSNSKAPMIPEAPVRTPTDIRAPFTGDTPLQVIPQAIPGDGRCLFRSVVHGALLREGKPSPSANHERELADEPRMAVVDGFIKRRADTEWYLEGDFDT